MLFCVEMTVKIPLDSDPVKMDEIKRAEKERATELQKSGKWPHLWRVTGKYSNISIFDVDSNNELHELLMSLPLFPYMDIKVTALSQHPSSIH